MSITQLANVEIQLSILYRQKKLNAAEYLTARGILYGQLGILTWDTYINELLSTRYKPSKTGQNRQRK